MQREYKKWALNTRVYGALYVGIRFFLIISSAIVAAGSRLNKRLRVRHPTVRAVPYVTGDALPPAE